MPFDKWQAPDRDSPEEIKFEPRLDLAKALVALLQMEGSSGTSEKEVLSETGDSLSRPRRWHKLFERMGLLYLDEDGKTRLTQLGGVVQESVSAAPKDFRRRLAERAISVLRKYQLKNPDDEAGGDKYPDDADLHPYWAIWKAAIELDGKLHWDELNRVLMWVLKHSELQPAIDRIKVARAVSGYDAKQNGSPSHPLGDRAYDQASSTDGRDPGGQVRDQRTTPWFKRAGFAEVLLTSPGARGEGYWTVHPDIADLLQREVERGAPLFRPFASEREWFEYYGRVDVETTSSPSQVGENDHEDDVELPNDLPVDDPVLAQVRALISAGSGGVVLSGPPGTGKSWYARRIAARLTDGDPGRVRVVQFHPSVGYDDFIEGFVPQQAESGVRFDIKPKVFLRLCKRAAAAPEMLHIMLVDELNRGDPSKIFGELLTYIEKDYRGQKVILPYSGKPLAFPGNVVVLATMNPYDKSVTDLDDALERRFDRIALEPSEKVLRSHLIKVGANGPYIGRLIVFFSLLQKKAPHGIGHTLFFAAKNESALSMLWNHKLRFIVEKMFRFEPEVLKEISLAYEGVVAAQPAPAAGAAQA